VVKDMEFIFDTHVYKDPVIFGQKGAWPGSHDPFLFVLLYLLFLLTNTFAKRYKLLCGILWKKTFGRDMHFY